MDRNSRVPYWPREEMSVTVMADGMRSGGGSACNFGIDIKKLDPGMWVETIGLVGDDAEGQFLLGEAERYGIDRRGLQVTGAAPTHVTDAFQSVASGRRTHVLRPGTSDLLSPDHFGFERTRGRILHLGLPGMHAVMDSPWQQDANGWVTVLRKARAAGLATNLDLLTIDPDRLSALTIPCLPYLDMLVVNDFEIGAIAGMVTITDGIVDEAACGEAARRVLERGSMGVVVVHHIQGALLHARDGTVMSKPSIKVPEDAYRGSNGAGDAFAAGFLYGYHEGWPYERALTLGHASAAASLRSITTVDGVESVAACLALAERWGTR